VSSAGTIRHGGAHETELAEEGFTSGGNSRAGSKCANTAGNASRICGQPHRYRPSMGRPKWRAVAARSVDARRASERHRAHPPGLRLER
jgi:hypothetical protein